MIRFSFDMVCILALHMGGLTPPVGLCVYSVKAVAPQDTNVMGIFKGAMPYLLMMIVITVIYILVPGLFHLHSGCNDELISN